ncbi:unnamed protein product [Protopolystoma xenopodis]|uniref:RRM domain-containing protein n=1 Tax=Protopolystoma xenopodis TaxID=117903 RepID=A0A448WZ63_9PLAT|nr:unnamed protein product [Protopolystoma xenopodis]
MFARSIRICPIGLVMPSPAWASLKDAGTYCLKLTPKDLIPEMLAAEPKLEDNEKCTIIVDGVPNAPPEKFHLLKELFMKKFSVFGNIVESYFPLDTNDYTAGYAFLTFEKPHSAIKALRSMQNFPLDKSHTLQVSLLTELDSILAAKDVFVPPPKQEYRDHGDLRSWLLNEYCRDQFAVAHGDGEIGAVYWHTSSEPILIETRNRWSEGWMKWSPRGTYLATLHQPGIALWGGEKFSKIGRFPHISVKMIDFSPEER